MKVIRAKITEEVNSRLVSAGVDPLKPRLPRSVFQKQRLLIHQQQELKAKVLGCYKSFILTYQIRSSNNNNIHLI